MKTAKKSLAIVLSVVMVLSAFVFNISAADFDSTWTAITDAAGLKAIENNYNGKYYLANDITLGDFDPIGWSDMDGDGSDDSFYGVFDGNGHTISGLTQDYGNATYTGLFAKNFGTISNLTIDGAYINAKDGVGVVAGFNKGTIENVTVQNCEVVTKVYSTNYDYTRSGLITGQNGTGGIIKNCTVKSCYIGGNIMVGGIAGSNLGTIEGCTVDAIKINSKSKNNTAQIEGIYNLGAKCLINQGYYRYYCIGGLVGNNQGTVSKCEVVTDAIVYGFQSVGGLVGYNSGAVTNCWFGVPDSVKDIPYYEVYNYPSDRNPQYTLSAKDTKWDIGENEAGATAEDIFGVTVDSDHVHSFTAWTVVKEATCTEDGLKTSVCDICGAKASAVIPALGHVDKNNDKICDVCGAETDCHKHVDADDNGFCDDCGENICEHASTTIVGAKDATCEEAGYTGDKVCDKCGVTIEKGTEIPKKGHTEVTDAAVAPTCTDTGLTEGKHCSVCGKVLVAQTVVPAKGHNYEVVGKKDATCEEKGYTGDEVCSNCGDVKSTGSVVPAKEHNDANGDGKCDDCGKEIGGGSQSGSKGNIFGSFFNWITRLLILIRHFLGMNR